MPCLGSKERGGCRLPNLPVFDVMQLQQVGRSSRSPPAAAAAATAATAATACSLSVMNQNSTDVQFVGKRSVQKAPCVRNGTYCEWCCC